MSDLNDTVGSDLPTMSPDLEAAFAAEEAAANAARAAAKGGGNVRIQPTADDGDDTPPAPTPAVPAAPAAAPTPAPSPAAPSPAAVAAAPPAPAGQAPADDNDPDAVLANDGKRYVPLDVMLARRRSDGGKIKDLEAALQKANEQSETLLKALGQRGEPAPAAVAPPAPPPEPEKNPYDEATHPFEHERWERLQVQKRLDAFEAANKQTEEQRQQQQALHTARTAYVSAHRDFAAANPAYDSAYKHVTEAWAKMYQTLGHPRAEALQLAEAAEWNIVQRAVEMKKHPSEMLWEVAKVAGWQPPAPGTPPAAAAPGTPPAPATPSPQKQIELAQQGAAAAVSLSDVQGGSAPQPPTLAAITAMSKEDFHAQFSGAAGEAAFRKLAMGGGKTSRVA